MNLKGFQDILKRKKSDVAIFVNTDSMSYSKEIAYFSGYTGVGAVIIPKNAKPFLLVPKMEVERAKKGHIKAVYEFDKKKFFESIKEILKRKKIKTTSIAISTTTFSYNLYKALKKEFKKTKIKDITKEFLKLRSIKTEKELKIIRKAFSEANKIFEKTIFNFRDFKTETDVTSFMQYEAAKKGNALSFPTIVASGKNASMPHYEPASKKLNKGLCVIDFGIIYQGYCTDMTRTIGIKNVTSKEKETYQQLLRIQKELVNQIKEKSSCSELYWNCVKMLGKEAKYFAHSLGHGVGVQIHELPNLSPNSEDIFEKNMVVTVEPGVYKQGKFGIRIEDTIIVGKKPIILTKPTKELITIK